MPVYYAPVDINYNGAVLRTVAEISAKLTYQGNIRQPMSLANLGKLLQREGYLQKRCTGGVRKYVVRELQNTAAEKEYEIQQLRTE
ncbi:MAG: hypothetical protein MJZ75_05730 [Paludibacteraceae bacterium]|nr:hypothetical protein [Paludibacteraceae bacterium]